jgi:hypothetical protein
MVFSTVLFYLNNMHVLSEKSKADSVIYETVEPLAPATIALVGKVIPPVKDIFHSMEAWFIELKEDMPAENEPTPE